MYDYANECVLQMTLSVHRVHCWSELGGQQYLVKQEIVQCVELNYLISVLRMRVVWCN